MISEEAVLAAAKASYEHVRPRMGFPSPFGEAPEPIRQTYIDMARVALEAAAPFTQRTINTIDELVALTEGSVVLDELSPCMKADGDWIVPLSSHVFTNEDITLPAILLHEPKTSDDKF